MENIEEVNKSEEIKRRIEENKITNYEDDSRSDSYTYKLRLRREKLKREKLEAIKKLFFEYLKFYNENYPASTHDIEWNDPEITFMIDVGLDFEEALDNLSEKELYDIHTILDYSRRETDHISIKERDTYLLTDAMITKRIPGWSILAKIEKIKEKQQKDNREIKQLEKLYITEKKEYLTKKQDQKEVLEVPEEPVKKEFLCEIPGCDKVCASKAGLNSHMRGHKKETEFRSGSLVES